MTKRQAILEALLTRLTSITRSNGFSSDCGDAVYVGVDVDLGPDDPAEAIGVAIGDERVRDESGSSPTTGGLVAIELPIHLIALTNLETLKSEAWRRREAIIGDIKTAVESGDRSLGSLLSRALQRGPTRSPQVRPGSVTLAAGPQYTLTYLETLGAPEAV